MLNVVSQQYSLNDGDIRVQHQAGAVDLAVITSLHGGNASQEICRVQTTKSACNAQPECEWNTGDCNDSGTGDWDQ